MPGLLILPFRVALFITEDEKFLDFVVVNDGFGWMPVLWLQ